jgi:hypothetical protein
LVGGLQQFDCIGRQGLIGSSHVDGAEQVGVWLAFFATEVDPLPDSSPETKKMYQKYFKEVMSTEPLSRKLGKADFRLLQEIYSQNEEHICTGF